MIQIIAFIKQILYIYSNKIKSMKKIYLLSLFIFAAYFSKAQNLPCYIAYTSSVTGGPYTSAVADFNKDGFMDVICAPNAPLTTVLLRLNDGQGNLSTSIITNTINASGASVWGITVGDYDNNTYMDYAVSKYQSAGTSQIFVFLNTGGSGTTFTLSAGSPIYSGSGTVTEIKTMRLNNDPLPDLYVGSGSFAFGVLLNTGSGNFAPMVQYNGGGLWGVNIESFDVDNDGNFDILVSGLQQNSIGLFMGSPTGTFALAPGFPIPSVNFPRQLDYADFNNDGKKDIVVAGQNSNDVGIHLATGTNSFAPAISFTTGANMFCAQAGDFNGDGKMDFVAASFTSSYYYMGNGTASFTLAPGYPKTGGTQYWSANKADLNGDGMLDAILSDRQAAGKIDILTASLPIVITASNTTICSGQSVVATASASGAGTFTWTPGNLTGPTQTLSPTSTTIYSVNALATPSSTCNYFSKFTISVSPCTSISEINGLESINVFPNPSNGILTIENIQGASIKLFNTIGDLLFEYNSESTSQKFEFNELNSGVYFIRISKETFSKTMKWIKE